MERNDTIDRLQEKVSDLGRLERHFGREQIQSIVERSKAQKYRVQQPPHPTFIIVLTIFLFSTSALSSHSVSHKDYSLKILGCLGGWEEEYEQIRQDAGGQ